MKKKVREGAGSSLNVPSVLLHNFPGMTEQQREEMENPWLYTQISDQAGRGSLIETESRKRLTVTLTSDPKL